jgi:hypothetical protein
MCQAQQTLWLVEDAPWVPGMCLGSHALRRPHERPCGSCAVKGFCGMPHGRSGLGILKAFPTGQSQGDNLGTTGIEPPGCQMSGSDKESSSPRLVRSQAQRSVL